MIPFVTNSEFLLRFDWRWISKNVLDNNSAATLIQLQTPTDPGGDVLAEFLSEASEDLMGAAAVAARYSEADIRTYGGSLCTRIVSDLTMGKILKRRGRALSDESALSMPYNEALGYLEQLRRGERIFFAVPLVPEAGLPGTAGMIPGQFNPGTGGQSSVTAAELAQAQCSWVNGARRYFGYGCQGGTGNCGQC